MKRKIQRQVTEYYTNGQVKMVVEYRGNWKSGDFTVLKHYDYDENGKLLKFKNEFARLDFLDKNYKKAINLEKKDYKNLWECALAINKIVKIGELDFSVDDGYKWAVKYCTINSNKIKNFSELKKSYNDAILTNNKKIIKFESNY